MSFENDDNEVTVSSDCATLSNEDKTSNENTDLNVNRIANEVPACLSGASALKGEKMMTPRVGFFTHNRRSRRDSILSNPDIPMEPVDEFITKGGDSINCKLRFKLRILWECLQN